MYKVYNSIESVFSKAAVRKTHTHQTIVMSHTVEILLHILQEEINISQELKVFPPRG